MGEVQSMGELQSIVMASPVGALTVVAGHDGLRAVLWPGESVGRVRLAPPPSPVGPGDDGLLDRAVEQLAEYFAGERQEFDLPLDPVGTEFQVRVWRSLAQIGFGETWTYGRQAEWLGRPGASRAVGAANGRNPLSIVLPCHRVVGASGSLTGFAGGLGAKRWLLAHEGVTLGG